ncbi:unnamed protein product, partial [Callosobruchus maculatus]
MTSVDFKKKTWQFHLPGPSGSGTAIATLVDFQIFSRAGRILQGTE